MFWTRTVLKPLANGLGYLAEAVSRWWEPRGAPVPYNAELMREASRKASRLVWGRSFFAWDAGQGVHNWVCVVSRLGMVDGAYAAWLDAWVRCYAESRGWLKPKL
jgi:hypothetical protein